MASDVTDLFETYRECARHVRNTYFSHGTPGDWDTFEDFEAVARVLFQRMILSKLDDRADNAVEENKLLIRPAADRIPLMISRERNAGGYWDHPLKYLKRDDARIAFRDYFDWDQHALTDFRYYHGVVLSSTTHPDIVEHEILIETIYGRAFYEGTPVV
jgi:hypothetical protein